MEKPKKPTEPDVKNYDKPSEPNGTSFRMAFKDDDGFWKITSKHGQHQIKYNSYEELVRFNPDLDED